MLFEKNQLPVLKKTPGGQPSTDEDVLEELALNYPLARLILDYRTVSKLKSTYTDKLPRMVNPRTGRVHTTFAQAVAVTGRLSSNEPNLQNIPIRNAEGRRIREAFIAPPGHHILSADYSQVELRIMAHLSGDENLMAAFQSGEDVHRRTAAEILGIPAAEVASEQRRYAKTINFGLIYGMSAFGLAAQLGIERSAAQQYMERYFLRYPKVKAYMEQTRKSARELGYVETVFGRRLHMIDIRASNNPRRQAAERAAINAPMQGTAADLIKLAMIQVQRWLRDQQLEQQADPAGARRTGVRSARRRSDGARARAAAADDRGCTAVGPVGGGRGRGSELGPRALTVQPPRRACEQRREGNRRVPQRTRAQSRLRAPAMRRSAHAAASADRHRSADKLVNCSRCKRAYMPP